MKMELQEYGFKIKFTDGTKHEDAIMAEAWDDAFPQVLEIAGDVAGERDVRAIIVKPAG